MKIFQGTIFFFQRSCPHDFFLALHEFIFFPYIIVFFLGGGGGIAPKTLTHRPNYLPKHLPPLLIKMKAARFFYESTKLLFPFYS